MRHIEPGGTGVVEIGERAFFELCFTQTGWIEPGVALFDQFFGGLGNGLYTRVVYGFFARRPGEWEGFEATLSIICGIVTDTMSRRCC